MEGERREGAGGRGALLDGSLVTSLAPSVRIGRWWRGRRRGVMSLPAPPEEGGRWGEGRREGGGTR